MWISTSRTVLSLCVAGSLAQAAAPDARYCEIAIDLSINGHAIAAPSAIIEYGKDAEITLSRDDGQSGWRFHVLADAPTTVRRMNVVIPVSVELYELAGGQEVLRAAPQLKVAPGQRADLETIFGDGDGRKAHIALVANPRSDADIEALRNDAHDGN
jgi:hypothetical protein